MLKARLQHKSRTLSVLVVALLSVVLASACSEPDGGGARKVPASDVGGAASDIGSDVGLSDAGVSDGGQSDGGQSDTDLDAEPSDVGLDVEFSDVEFSDAEEVDGEVLPDVDSGGEPDVEVVQPYPLCGPVVDLGWLMPGKQTVTVDFSTLEDNLATQCANAQADSKEAVFSFRLTDEGEFRVTSSSPVTSELRHRPCEDDSRAILCAEDGLSVQLSGNEPRFLVLELLAGEESEVPGSVEVEIELIPTPRCEDPGVSQCVDAETIERCDVTASSPDISRLTRGTCSQGCVDDRCLGDSCEAPIVVTDRVAVEGDGNVYHDTHDSQMGAGCHSYEYGYYEPELVFVLPDLVAGNQILIESFGEVSPHNVLIKSSCTEAAACLGYFKEASMASWEVPADGTYYVIVENGEQAPGAFQIAVEVKRD